MSTNTETIEDFVPHIYKSEDGTNRFTVEVEPNYGIGNDILVKRLLGYVQDGVVLAIVDFILDDDSIDDDGKNLTFAAYYIDGVPHPEYFENLSVIDVAQMLNQEVFVDLIGLKRDVQLWRVVDMRESRTGHDYFVAVPKDGDSVRFELAPYVWVEPDMPPTVLNYNELLTLVTDPPFGPTLWYVDHLLDQDEVMTWDEFYSTGHRLMIEDYSRSSDEKASEELVSEASAE
ncbi:MAG: hypothetical protein JWO54_610 [Candidatus Saccharibacteria bacterium]|nr:hypothetical protein [Candidatus Saccharibacteria bacterium]MDB5180850.1 hypothetical protein [Candidatus Saccharibacteria bacterium]